MGKWLRCEGLRSLTKFLQLAEAVSGCPMREGMVSISAAIAVIFAAPMLWLQHHPSLLQQTFHLLSPTSSLLKPAPNSSLLQASALPLASSWWVEMVPVKAMCLPRILKEDGELSVATTGPSPMLMWSVSSWAIAKLSSSMEWPLHLVMLQMVQAHAMGSCHMASLMPMKGLPVLELRAG